MATQNASLQPIYDRLNAVEAYHPMSADTFADWSMEAGDLVTVTRDNVSYKSPVHSMKLVWRGAPQITINSTGKEEREAVAKTSRRKYGRGGAGLRNDQSIYRDLYSEDGKLHSELVFTESILRVEFEAGITSTRTALESELEMTASHLEVEFRNADAGLRSELEMTASHLEVEFTDRANELESEIEITASHLRTEFTDSDERLKSEFEITASHMRTEYTDGIAGVHSEVVQTASSWAASVASVADANGNITPASIALGINASSGESEAKLDANRVYIGNDKSTTVINGKCSLSDVTADYIKTQIASITEVVMLAGNVTGTLKVRNGSGQQQDVTAGIWDLTISQSGNTYTLKRKRMMDSDWVDVGSFSRATSLDGAWSSGTLTVTASPQGDTFVRTLIQDTANATWSGNTVSVPIKAEWTVGASTYSESTGRNVYIDFGSHAVVNVTHDPWSTVPAGQSGFASIVFKPDAGTGTSETLQVGMYKAGGVPTDGTQTIGVAAKIDSGSWEYVKTMNFAMTASAFSNNKSTVTLTADTTTECTLEVDASGVYANGWAAAYAKVELPTNSTSATSATLKVPNATSSSNPLQNTYTLSMGNNGNNSVYMYLAPSGGNAITICKFDHNKYTAGESAGWAAAYAKVVLPTSSTSATSATLKVPNATNTSNPLQNTYTLSMGNNGNNSVYMYLAPSGGNAITICKFDHNKYYAGSAAVNLAEPTWNAISGSLPTSRTVTVSTSGRTNSSGTTDNLNKSVGLYLTQGSWSSNQLVVSMRTGSTSGTAYAQTTVDASSLVTSAGYAGRAAVTLAEPTWNSASGTPTSRTVTVSTTGRTNTSGTTDNLSKSVSLYLTTNGLTVSMRAGSQTGTVYAANTCSDANLVAGNIKNGVSIFGVTGTYSASVTPSSDIQIGSYTNTRSDPGSSYVEASTMASTIKAAINNHNWFGFKVTINGVTGQKYYKCNFTS